MPRVALHSQRTRGFTSVGLLLETYGAYEMNGITFQNRDEIWWLETIGGHHRIARRVPDGSYVVMPNQLELDQFELEDAFGGQKQYLCSKGLREIIAHSYLNLSPNGGLNPRDAFGSNGDSDYVYNTLRAWFMLRYFNPRTKVWDGPTAAYTPRSDDLPWGMMPEKKITPEDVKYTLSSHCQGTSYDPYDTGVDPTPRGAYRAIGISRNDFMALLQLRAQVPEEYCAVEWLAFASNTFNAMAPFYANVSTTIAYLSQTTQAVSTESCY